MAADAEKLLRRSVGIRHERDRLVRDLQQRNADVRAAMTEVQGAMAQADQSAQARARVLAAASHDLRQEPEPLRTLGDPIAISRIARNLIDNAIKYTDHGTVRISLHAEASPDAALAVLAVTDTGKGIPASGTTLKHFADANGRVCTYDALNGKSWFAAVGETAVEGHFYSGQLVDGKVNSR